VARARGAGRDGVRSFAGEDGREVPAPPRGDPRRDEEDGQREERVSREAREVVPPCEELRGEQPSDEHERRAPGVARGERAGCGGAVEPQAREPAGAAVAGKVVPPHEQRPATAPAAPAFRGGDRAHRAMRRPSRRGRQPDIRRIRPISGRTPGIPYEICETGRGAAAHRAVSLPGAAVT
jgi:hypothetical protein